MDEFVKIGKYKLKINGDKTKYTPDEQKIIGARETLDTLAYSVVDDVPALMIGETGVGKTALIRYLAYKTNNGFRRLNLNGQTTVDEFVGKILLDKSGTYWQDGVLTDAMRNGYWLLLDEINAALPEILFVLHSLLDDDRYVVLSENDGEVLRPHPNFRLFATMNPSGKYAGTKDLNKAFLSRFPIIINLDYPTPKEEEKIVANYSDLDEQSIKNLVKMANDLRASYYKDEIDFVCSTRDLISCAKVSQTLGLKRALQYSILNRCNEEDRKAVQTVVSLYFGTAGKAVEFPDYEKEYNNLKIKVENSSREIRDYLNYVNNYVDTVKKYCEVFKVEKGAIRSRVARLRYKREIVNELEQFVEFQNQDQLKRLNSISDQLKTTLDYVDKLPSL